MQIKVKDTRMQKTKYISQFEYSKEKGYTNREGEIQIAEAKLVLIESTTDKTHNRIIRDVMGKLYINNKFTLETVLQDGGCPISPILISTTEKLSEGDSILNTLTNTISRCENEFINRMSSGVFFKILALPEHFSPKHLQAIVDGKLKDGDKVLVECEQLRSEEIDTPIGKINMVMAKSPHNNESNSDMSVYKHFVKLNSSNHITLHKVEEKMVPISLLEKAWDAGFDRGVNVESGGYDINTTTALSKKEWFEQNVK